MHNDFNTRFVRNDGKPARTFIEVLELLGNRTLVFAGDSVGSQLAMGAECSWQRGGAKTISRSITMRTPKLGWMYGSNKLFKMKVEWKGVTSTVMHYQMYR